VSLRSDAVELARLLREVVRGLNDYDADNRSSYTRSLAQRLRPLVEAFDFAVSIDRSRESADRALTSIKIEMAEVNGAATMGDIAFVADGVLDPYWELCSIFQEQRYRGQAL
jgi:hypothetical protein